MVPGPKAVVAAACRRALVVYVIVDVFLTIGMVMAWSLLGLVDVRVGVLTSLLRSLLWFAHLRFLLGPARALPEPCERASDDQLLAADAALTRLSVDAALSFSALWFVTELGWTALMHFDVPVEVVSGRAELAAGLLLPLTALGLPSIMRMLLEQWLGTAHEHVAQRIARRRLVTTRPPASLTRPLVVTAISMLCGALIVCGAAVVIREAQTARARALEVQLLRAQLGALQVSYGDAPSDELELLTHDELPTTLARALADAGQPSTGVALYEPAPDLVLAAVPLDDGRYAVATSTPDLQLGVIVGVLLIVLVFAGASFGLGFSLFARALSEPLERLSDTVRAFIEHGRLRAREHIIPLRNDEMGRLTRSFDAMLDLLEELAIAAGAVAGGHLTVELEHPGELHEAFRGMLMRLNGIVRRLRETSLELASAAAEIGALTQQQEQAMLTQASNIHQVADTVASLATSAQQIAAAAEGVLHNAEQAVATTDASAQQITTLRQHTASIGELLHLIGEIAKRSDLLALNGSLESTRAGEAGRGFSLVAAEMRRLAERVSGTVDDVRVRVAEVETSSTGTVSATERSRELAQRTAAAARDISQVTATQSADTHQASLGVQSVADMVTQATRAMSQTRAAAEGLRDHAAELERLIQTFELREEDDGAAPG